METQQRAAAQLREVIQLIDAGQLEATKAERAFIAGSILTAESLCE